MNDQIPMASPPAALNWREEYHRDSVIEDAWVDQLAGRIEACLRQVEFNRNDLDNLAKGTLARLREPHVTIAFCGRMKAGKTLLINRLLGRNILPVNINTETGLPCFISSGSEDQATLILKNGRESIPCTTESIRNYISLWKRLQKNGSEEPVKRVELQLTDCPVPPNVTWVDTPGLDDNESLRLVTLEVFDNCDLLVWIANSELCIISMSEMDTIDSYVQQYGAQGIAFLTNVICRDQQYASTWHDYVSRQLPVLEDRYQRNWRAMGLSGKCPPRMLSVCALAMQEGTDSPYGAGEVNHWIRSINSARHTMVRAARLHRTAIALQTFSEHLAECEAALRQASLEAEAERAARVALAAKNRMQFELQAENAIDVFVSQLSTELIKVAKWIAGDITIENFTPTDGYRLALDAQVKKIGARLTNEFEQTLRLESLNYDQKRAGVTFPMMPPYLPVLGVLEDSTGSGKVSLGGLVLAPRAFGISTVEREARIHNMEATKRNIVAEAQRLVKNVESIRKHLRTNLLETYPREEAKVGVSCENQLALLTDVRAELALLQQTALEWAEINL